MSRDMYHMSENFEGGYCVTDIVSKLGAVCDPDHEPSKIYILPLNIPNPACGIQPICTLHCIVCCVHLFPSAQTMLSVLILSNPQMVTLLSLDQPPTPRADGWRELP